MKHEWTKRRVLIEHTDGQRRWDRAYQMVLMWATVVAIPPPSACEATCLPSPQPFQEDNDGSQRSERQVSVSGYVRVSTQRQAQAQTIEQQLDRIQAYAQQQGWMLNDTHIFRDDGYSGATLNRPGLDRLRDAVRCGEVTHILMTAPDRLARSYVHQVLLMEEFKQLGCMVTFLDRPMSQDPHDQLLLQIRGAVAEYERTLIADRMRRGRQLKLKAGTLLPWTHVPFGYRVDPDHPRDPTDVRVDDVECAWVREMFAWYAGQGHSLIGLAWHLQELGVPTPTPTGKTRWNQATVRGILTNPAYVGEVYANRQSHTLCSSPGAPFAHPAHWT